jgi:tetratricopeptide (TPR) repeat protein
MRKIFSFFLLIQLVLLASCCFDIGSKESKFRKRMLCARRVNNENSIRLLKNRAFCCPVLPAEINDISSARRWYYLKAAEIYPENEEVLAAIGQTYWEEAKFSDAIGYYRKANEVSPKNIQFHIAVITLERIDKRYDEALKAIETLSKPDFSGREKTVNYLQGKILYEKGDLDGARLLMEKSIAEAEKPKGDFYLGPTPYTMHDVYFYMAMITLKQKNSDPQKAHEYFLKYLSKEGHPDFVNMYQESLRQSAGDQEFLYEMVETGWTRTHQ